MWNVSVSSVFISGNRFGLCAAVVLAAVVCAAAYGAESAGTVKAAAVAPGEVLGEVAGEVVSVHGLVFVRADGREVTKKPKPTRPGDYVKSGDVVNTSSDGKVKILFKDKSIVDLGPASIFKVDHYMNNQGDNREADFSMMYGTLRAAISKKITGKGRFNVRTPAATMGVRGTEFVVKSEIRNMEEVKHVVKNPGKVLPSAVVAPAVATTKGGKVAEKAAEAPKTEITVIKGEVEVKKEVVNADKAKAAAAGGINAGAVTKGAAVSVEKVMLSAGTQLVAKQGDVEPAKPVVLDTKQLAVVASEAKVQDNTFHNAVVIEVEKPEKKERQPEERGEGRGREGREGREVKEGKDGRGLAGDRGPGGEYGPRGEDRGGEDRGGDGGGYGYYDGGAAGSATMAELQDIVAMPVVAPVPVGEIGFAGTFGAVNTFEHRPVVEQQGLNRMIRVIVVRKQ